MGRWTIRLVMVAWGALGVVGVLALLHVWQDHRDLHTLVRAVAQAQAARGAR